MRRKFDQTLQEPLSLDPRPFAWFRQAPRRARLAGLLIAVLVGGLAWAGLSGADPEVGTGEEAQSESEAEKPPMDRNPFEHRVPAPPLDGGEAWLNVREPLKLEDLRGKFVVLDFWTYCCINCIQLLPELKKFEDKWSDEVVVIGVHSPKFTGEAVTENIAAAIGRYRIEHPVVNDAKHAIWQRYNVSAWPTLVVIDPEGNIVAMQSGETPFEALDRFFETVTPYYRNKGLLDANPRAVLERPEVESIPAALKFPGKVLANEGADLLAVADSGHNRIVIADLQGEVKHVVGTGAAGHQDGGFEEAEFDSPQGMVLDGQKLYVADTNGQRIRLIDLEKQTVSTIAGTGQQGRGYWPGFEKITFDPQTNEPKFPKTWRSKPLETNLASPWALAIHNGWLYIAMAGAHQIWRMRLPQGEIEVYAGDGREDISDGRRVPSVPPRVAREGFAPGYSAFAQPSGLASDGRLLYVADSEGSSIRAVPLSGDDPVSTVVGAANLPRGRSLFTFGDKDGKAENVRLQHVLGITLLDDQLYVADTYNHKIKRVDPSQRTATTLDLTAAEGSDAKVAKLAEPAGIANAGGKLYVADTNNHRIVVIDPQPPHAVRELEMVGLEPPIAEPDEAELFAGAVRVESPPVSVAADEGELRLRLVVALPPPWKLNPLFRPRYQIDAVDGLGPLAGEGLGRTIALPKPTENGWEIKLPLKEAVGEVRLRVRVSLSYCTEGELGVCKFGAIEWEVPITLASDAPQEPVVLSHLIDTGSR